MFFEPLSPVLIMNGKQIRVDLRASAEEKLS
jgi:hypothetical protein